MWKGNKVKVRQLQENNNIVETYNIKFPFYIDLYKIDFDEEKGDKPIELTGEDAYKILTQDDIEGICFDFESSELYQYWDRLGKKIINMQMQILENGFIKIIVSVRHVLSDDEKQELLNLLSGQMSDGWGEGNFDYEKETGERYEVRFWKYSDWNIDFL